MKTRRQSRTKRGRGIAPTTRRTEGGRAVAPSRGRAHRPSPAPARCPNHYPRPLPLELERVLARCRWTALEATGTRLTRLPHMSSILLSELRLVR